MTEKLIGKKIIFTPHNTKHSKRGHVVSITSRGGLRVKWDDGTSSVVWSPERYKIIEEG